MKLFRYFTYLQGNKKGETNLKKRSITVNRNRIQNNSRRRQMLKKVHLKVLSRRQQFNINDDYDGQVAAC